MEQAYKNTVWTLPDNYLSFERFEVALRGLEMSSSPGWPYVLSKPTIGEWLGFDGVVFDAHQVSSLWYDVNLVMAGVFEIELRCFIKQEPHSLDKARNNRWRLIMALPLSVQVLWQMLFKYQNDLEIAKAYEIPSQQGIVICGGGWKIYRESWVARGFNMGLDKRAWDWTAPYWLIQMDLQFRYRMGRGSKMAEWMGLACEMYEKVFERPLVRLSNGLVLRQKFPGIFKSGLVNTISSNSHMQVMIHLFYCREKGLDWEPLPVACGDDTLQSDVHTVDVDCYARYGAIVKSASQGLEFVGHEFLRGGPVPLYNSKHFAKFRHVKDEDMAMYLDSMCRLYAHSELFDVWIYFARELGVEDQLLSKQAYQFWYDFEI
uniref:RNA-directed RNA polymerase n=1 Tax=Solemoviridae sp. TaxID=2715208 RepID=A0A6M3YPM3_9VIRU|nr:MAG: hypothetical protein 2 [Solemoviridae sp.]